jgi:hypothetical protein
MTLYANNILTRALKIIPRHPFTVEPWLGQAIDDRGIVAPSYGTPITIIGHVQAVQRNVYQNLGLDFQKSYIRVYTDSAPIGDLARDRSADLITWQGKMFKANGAGDWMILDGWQRILCVQI